MYDGPKRDFERLCREFAAKAQAMAGGLETTAHVAKSGETRDYIQFVSTSIAATAQAVEACSVPTFEEWHERMHKLPPIVMMAGIDDPFGDGSL